MTVPLPEVDPHNIPDVLDMLPALLVITLITAALASLVWDIATKAERPAPPKQIPPDDIIGSETRV
jgi:hypothetical protein